MPFIWDNVGHFLQFIKEEFKNHPFLEGTYNTLHACMYKLKYSQTHHWV